jgi:thiol-disulfide isomerase/thioredoxin
MKRTIFLLTLVIFFSGCNRKDRFTVGGVIKGETKKYIYLSRLDVDTPILIDSAKISSRGIFRFNVKASDPDFYQLGFSGENFITLLAEPGEKIDLAFESKNLFEQYTVSGTAGSEKLLSLDLGLSDTRRKLDSLRTLYSKASNEPGFDVKGPALEEQFTILIKNQRMKNIEFIISNTGSLASLKALYQKIDPQTYVLYDPKDIQFYKILTDSLSLHYPNSKHVQALARDFTKEMNQMYVNQLAQLTKDLPQTELDPKLKNVDGIRVALSSLRGKYVLLTFWSIQSKESVAENLQLKQFYKLYNKKGFEIYQINLDENQEAWKSAVRYDELPWISTIEDDPKNPVNAVLFNVRSLPTNYLFDKEGKIIGTNLHGKSLQIKLDQLFSN